MNRPTGRAPSPRRPRVPSTAFVLLLLLAVDLLGGVASAHHDGGPVPEYSETPTPEDDISTHPTIDHARADLQRLHEALVAELNDRLNVNASDVTSPAPRYSSNVLYDSFEPNARVGGIGDWTVVGGHWTSRAQAGQNASTGWTMAEPDGTYESMDTILVMPSLDLSAYPMPLGQVPYLYRLHDQDTQPPTNNPDRGRTDDDVRDAFNSTGDHVTLIIDQRYDFFDRQDGGQLLIFTSPPSRASEGTTLHPRSGPEYQPSTAIGGRAYTGYAPWHTASFDLTPWSGQRVWIGFHVKTDPRASDDASYFSSGFGSNGPYGWSIDNIQVLAPSHGINLKVVGIDGPTLRLDNADPYARAAPGSTISVGAIVLNAGANTREARVRLTSDAAAGSTAEQSKLLRPGEVWTPRIDVRAPAESDRTFRVDARAWTVSPDGNRTLPDATEDNVASATYVSSAIRKFDVETEMSSIVVDDDAPMEATTRIRNLGNLPENLTVTMTTWHANGTARATRVAHAPMNFILAPGKDHTFAKAMPTELRGEHLVLVNVTAHDGQLAQSTARYYVHASPPLLFDAVDHTAPNWTTAKLAWERGRADVPVPSDGWMWKFRGSTAGSVLILTPDSTAAATSARYTDLEMTIRYMGFQNQNPAVVSIGYASSRYSSLEELEREIEPWRHVLPMFVPELAASDNIQFEQELSWKTLTLDVRPSASAGYIDLWASRGLEVRLWAKAVGAQLFYLDELVLTGVPEGGSFNDRVTLVRATGSEGDTSSETPAATTVPAQPSDCGLGLNCWMRVPREEALLITTHTNWTVATPTVGGAPALWGYRTAAPSIPATERLTSPVIAMGPAPDPVLTFEHEFLFPAAPRDTTSNALVQIAQIGYVELQYRRDDGSWSDFVRLVPDGGYADPLGTDGGGVVRLGNTQAFSFSPGDGYYAPGKCIPDGVICYVTGAFLQHRRANGDIVLHDPPRGPFVDRATFRLAQQPGLAGVDLSDRDIRLGFHVSPKLKPDKIEPTSWWSIRDVKLAPLSSFAVDAAVESVALETTYDWKRLGVSPGSTVPVNVTVRNTGLFAEEFVVDVGAHRVGEPGGEPTSFDVGLLRPGESTHVVAFWDVPAEEDVYYVLEAVVRPASAEDENPRDDAYLIGDDGTLLARTVIDLATTVDAFPDTGRETLARYSPILIYNHGNTDVRGATLTRTITRYAADGGSAAGDDTWTIASSIPADGRPVSLQQLIAEPAPLTSDFFLVPGVAGSYDVDVRITPPSTDAREADNRDRATFVARPAVYAADFEEDVDWTHDSAWSVGDGFRSAGSLFAGNATAKSLPADLDAKALTPTISLAGQRSALVNLMARHELERGYDGFRLEASTDGAVWYPVQPESGMAGDDGEGTIATLVGSNPLARDAYPEPVSAVTGSSAGVLSNLDGWVPYAFDLGSVDAFTEAAVIRELRAPSAVGEPLTQRGSAYASSSMIIDPNDDAARWEIRNETEHRVAVSGTMRYSGYATPGSVEALTATFGDVPSLQNGTAVLTWWDWRPGTLNTSIDGVGGERTVSVSQMTADGFVSVGGPVQVVERRADGWNQLSIELDPKQYIEGATFRVAFEMKGVKAAATTVSDSRFDLGWAVDEISFASHRVVNGTRATLHHSTPGNESSADSWTGWQTVDRIPAQPGGWSVVHEFGPDGTATPLWKFSAAAPENSNLDARLVTPAIDLTTLSGGEVTMRLWHRYDLLYIDRYGLIEAPEGHDFLNAYQGGTVEIQRFNQTTLTWDPWRQLYTGAPPTQELATRHVVPIDGAPYDKTIPGSTDTFARYPRALDKTFQNGVLRFTLPLELDTAYAFSGSTPGAGFVLSEFDLSPFAGESVRLAFHAWAGAAPFNATGNLSRHWTLGQAEIVGRVLSIDEVQLRARVATDASVRGGGVAIDQFEVSAVPQGESISLRLDPMPTAVARESVVRISGNISNRAGSAREMIAVALKIRSLDGRPLPEITTLTPTLPVDPAGPYYAITGPFALAPINEENDTRAFDFRLLAPVFPDRYVIDLEVVDARIGSTGYTFTRAPDDIPGRSEKQLTLEVADRRSVELLELRVDPPALAAPGAVTVAGTARASGTLPFGGTLHADWLRADGSTAATSELAVPSLAAGATWNWSLPASLAEIGNLTLRVRVFNSSDTSGSAEASLRYRVGATDVAFTDSFETGFDRWFVSGVTLAKGDAHDGNASALFQGISQLRAARSVDLAGLGPGAVLSFWHRPSQTPDGSIQVALEGGVGPDTLCIAILYNATAMRSTTWQRVEIPLSAAPCESPPGREPPTSWTLRFRSTSAMGGSWNVDGIALHANPLEISPNSQSHVLQDGARKLFPVVLTNPGLAPRDVVLGVDERNSTLTRTQRDWIKIIPSRVTLAPGASTTVTLSVTTPSAAAAFPQILRLALNATDVAASPAPSVAAITLDFQPRSRSDVVVDVAVDGEAARSGLGLEEAVGHDISVVFRNAGTQPSLPLEARAWIVHDASGNIVWEQAIRLEPLTPRAKESNQVETFVWRPTFGLRGAHTLRVVVDPDRHHLDFDRSNDDVTIRLAVTPLVRPDLVVDEATPKVSDPNGRVLFEAYAGDLVRVEAVIHNAGLAPARDVAVRLVSGSVVLKEELVAEIPPGGRHVIQATQIVPENATTYRVLTFTPDIELDPSNNERTLHVPVFAPELRLVPETSDDVSVRPGASPRPLAIEVRNDGAYPLVLDLDAEAAGSPASVEPAQLALAPGERRNVTAQIGAAPRALAGERLLVLHVRSADQALATRLTVPYQIVPVVDGLVSVREARGPPDALRIVVDVVNTGNVALAPEIFVEEGTARVATTSEPATLAPGEIATLVATASLPADTPPGARIARIGLRHDGATLAGVNATFDVRRWERVTAVATATTVDADELGFDIALRYDANAPRDAELALVGLPAAVEAQFSHPTLRLTPGATATTSLLLRIPSDVAPGLYEPRVVLFDPAGGAPQAIATLEVDLRRADLRVRTFERAFDDALLQGDDVIYVVTVRNLGTRETHDEPVSLFVDGVLVARALVDGLAPGDERKVRLRWLAAAGSHAVAIQAGDEARPFVDAIDVGESFVTAATRLTPGPGSMPILVIVALAALLVQRRGWGRRRA